MRRQTPLITPPYFLLAKEVKELIRNDKAKKALHLLNEHLKGHESENTVILKLSEQNSLKREILTGQISFQNATIQTNTIKNTLLEITDDLIDESIKSTKIYISYLPNDSHNLSQNIFNNLTQRGFQVCRNQDILVGTNETIALTEIIKGSNYFLFLLNDTAEASELVQKELEIIQRVIEEGHSVRVIPIKIQLSETWTPSQVTKKLIADIRPLNIQGPQQKDTAMLKIQEVIFQQQITQQRVPPHTKVKGSSDVGKSKFPLEVAKGVVSIDSNYYIQRHHESLFIRHIESPGALMRIRGPRQYGKTSLLARVNAHCKNLGYNTLVIDFQEFDENTVANLDNLLYEFCYCFADRFRQEEVLDKRWAKPRPKGWTASKFIERDILQKCNQPLLVAIDEADRLFHYPEVSKEFFSKIRAWHEDSKLAESESWKKFRLALSYSTETRLAVQDMNTSPFNVGVEDRLMPFTKDQVNDLAVRHNLNWSAEQYQEIMELLGGQPFLVRQAMYLLASEKYNYKDLIAKATTQDGPFGNHLRNHLANIKKVAAAEIALNDILERGQCFDPIMASKLEATGLVQGAMTEFKMANSLYAAFFKGKL